MKKAALAISALSLAMSIPAVASAQGPSDNCPPGSWFCADTQTPPAAAPNQPVQPAQPLQPLPPTAAQPTQPAQPPPAVVYQPAPPPPVVVYQPAAPTMIVRESPRPTAYVYRVRPPDYFRRNEWGLNLHLMGALHDRKGSESNSGSGMGGAGFGLRYKPIPHVGLEANLDFITGRDYYGNKRDETAFTTNLLLFLNPRSRTQVYLLGGLGWSGASVEDSRWGERNYSYFGGQLGVGLEFRILKHFALNADLRGFVRGRTDRSANDYPEYRDAAGRTTNTSGGGLLTAGMTFYF